jgi:hypothetical protein
LPFAEADAIFPSMGADGESLYRDLMRFKPEELTANAWAVKAGVSRTVWADLRRHGNPARRTLEKLLGAAGSSLAEFEALRLGGAPGSQAGAAARVGDARGWGWTPAPVPPLPLIVTALAGEWGKPGSRIELTEIQMQQRIDRVPRPDSLAGDPEAFAITIVGDSMWPRFRPGRRVAVSPRSPIAVGDDVLLLLRALDNAVADRGVQFALVKELVRRSSGLVELRQFNPDLTIRVREDDIAEIHRIAGEIL